MSQHSAQRICHWRAYEKISNKLSKKTIFHEFDKRREKETQLLTTYKTFIVQQTRHQLRRDINGNTIFEFKKIGWNLSRLRKKYKLTKRTNTEK